MKTYHISISKVALTAVFVAILAAAIYSFAAPARAAMGNRGVPVRCYADQLKPAESKFLTCKAADGTAFTGNQRVPAGYYLLVTDIVIIPDAGTDTSGIVSIVIYDAYGTSSHASSITARSGTMDGFGYHFHTPYFVLEEGHRIEASPWWFNSHWAAARVTGILTNNVTYLPVTSDGG